MRRLCLLLALTPLPACVAPGEDRIATALVGRSVDYTYGADIAMADREVQSWSADGRTEIRNHYNIFTSDITGRWRVEDGRYCEIFGSQTEWTCLRVTFLDGDLIRFKEYPEGLGEVVLDLFGEDRTGRFLPEGG